MRDAILTLALGRKKIGKTYTSLQLLYQYAKGTKKAKPRKVLIYDVNGEYSDKFKSIDPRYISIYGAIKKPDIRRVTGFHDNGQPLSTDELKERLFTILKSYTNGLLIVEDINKYISDSISNELIGFLAVMRHKGVDTIAHFQTKGKAGHPKLFGMTNYIRLHETTDSFERHKDKFKDNLKVLKIAEMLVKLENQKRPLKKHYFYCYIDTELIKISGQFSRQDFKDAILEYILKNPNETVKPMLNYRDRKGNKIYKDWETAINGLQQTYFNEFYGN